MTQTPTAREVVLLALRVEYARTREPVSCDALVKLTRLPRTTIEWHLRPSNADADAVRRRAGYEPLFRHAPDRAMSLTPLDDGALKVEIGDMLISLTPGELRKLVPCLVGHANTQG